MLYTTLKLLKEQNACYSGLSTLIDSLGAKHSEDKQISLAHIQNQPLRLGQSH